MWRPARVPIRYSGRLAQQAPPAPPIPPVERASWTREVLIGVSAGTLTGLLVTLISGHGKTPAGAIGGGAAGFVVVNLMRLTS